MKKKRSNVALDGKEPNSEENQAQSEFSTLLEAISQLKGMKTILNEVKLKD